MNPHHLVIIGGVAGGASAAARARRHSESTRITVIERGPDVSFANCGLPYHIGGEIKDRGELALQTPDSLRRLLNLEVLTMTEATAIDPEAKTVTLRSVVDGTESSLSFDRLILSPGVPLTHPKPHAVVDLARDLGVEVIGDIELFARQKPLAPVIAITGTNGKSTTTALTAHLLDSCGRPAIA